ncbi:MAG TPA: transposase [Spirochaetota bacterium]|nr:transposase [Spirochaetota bacterium]
MKGEKIGKNPTDRAKNGTKRHIYVDGNSIPLGLSLSGADVHDITMYKECLKSCIIKGPSHKEVEQHICLDKGYDSKEAREFLGKYFIVHIPERKNRKKENKITKQRGRRKARRWVVERTGAWHNKFR